MATDPRIAVLPGSYDPMTNGHLDVIRRAAKLYDEVIVAVVNSSVRKTKPMFSAEERIGFLEEATVDLPHVRAEPFDILIVDFARKKGARAIVKGLRAISDFEYEMEMAQLNQHQATDIESVYLMSGPQYSFRAPGGEKAPPPWGGEIDDLVPASAAARLKEEL